MSAGQVAPRDRWFEDWSVGDTFLGDERYVMDRERMVAFAEEFDPQVFHVDPDRAAETTYGGLIASGWHTGSAMMRLITGFLGESSLGSPGVDELRWRQPVRPGDELRLRWTVVEARRSNSKPDRGILRVHQEMLNQHGEVVMSMTATMLIAARPAAGPHRKS